ncbi:NADH-dependent flavin oxidoreductase [Paracoccus liaowanqingii]|uniref:NADH-dependent flavin oxidoreductase n=1 Tax=Paracoccus liaowanqingii TaxID=2560053 RepID=A0A4Z1C4I5_9RHOB|nr:NADH-dependent flavin oxidoreductase [Paracoccus liaowanqingii]TGN61976.1 NADH-dependent flavin oxidoreductase [Paracoccus liaowanqingii]
MSYPELFASFTLTKDVTLRNRIVLAPMTTWSGNPDGTVADVEIDWMRRRAGGVGMVLTGCAHVQANGIGFTDEFAAYDDRFLPGLTRLAEAAKSGGALAVLQIFHAGNKALRTLTPNGEVVSASDVPTDASPFAPSITPRALNRNEVFDVIAAFGDATRRAVAAGFDGIELHGAHGFLIQNFLSPRFNQRTDKWGGSLENRMRFSLALVAEVARVAATAGRPFVVGYRISPEEPGIGGLRIAEALTLTDRLIEAGVTYIHASLSDVLNAKPLDATDDKTIAKRIVDQVAGRVPVIAAGMIRTPAQAEQALATGLPLVAVGRGLVINPDWVERARDGNAAGIATSLDLADAPALAIPAKLTGMIRSMPGWFDARETAPAN